MPTDITFLRTGWLNPNVIASWTCNQRYEIKNLNMSEPIYFIRFNLRHPVYRPNRQYKDSTGTLPLRRFFGPRKNRVRGKPHYRRSILVLKPQNVEYESSKSTFWAKCTTCKINKSGECSKCHVKIGTNFLPL